MSAPRNQTINAGSAASRRGNGGLLFCNGLRANHHPAATLRHVRSKHGTPIFRSAFPSRRSGQVPSQLLPTLHVHRHLLPPVLASDVFDPRPSADGPSQNGRSELRQLVLHACAVRPRAIPVCIGLSRGRAHDGECDFSLKSSRR